MLRAIRIYKYDRFLHHQCSLTFTFFKDSPVPTNNSYPSHKLTVPCPAPCPPPSPSTLISFHLFSQMYLQDQRAGPGLCNLQPEICLGILTFWTITQLLSASFYALAMAHSSLPSPFPHIFPLISPSQAPSSILKFVSIYYKNIYILCTNELRKSNIHCPIF